MTNKTTQKDMFNEIIELAKANNRADIVEFAKSRIELLNKKSENKKPSKTQVENVGIKATIAEVLTENGSEMTVTEIVASGKFAPLTTPQKISALLKQMVDEGGVVRTYEKKVARFSMAPAVEDEDENEVEETE